jgi:hypothetical protein
MQLFHLLWLTPVSPRALPTTATLPQTLPTTAALPQTLPTTAALPQTLPTTAALTRKVRRAWHSWEQEALESEQAVPVRRLLQAVSETSS